MSVAPDDPFDVFTTTEPSKEPGKPYPKVGFPTEEAGTGRTVQIIEKRVSKAAQGVQELRSDAGDGHRVYVSLPQSGKVALLETVEASAPAHVPLRVKIQRFTPPVGIGPTQKIR